MATHGVPRTQQPSTPASLDAEAAKIKTYQDQLASLALLLSSHTYTNETLNITTTLLQQNPEHYTIWNNRRIVLLELLDGTPTGAAPAAGADCELLKHDIDWIIPLLIKYPKCYWIWNHRIWCLDQIEKRDASLGREVWGSELKLVGKMLGRDSRNFHGWDYRRIVVGRLRSSRLADTSGATAGLGTASNTDTAAQKQIASTEEKAKTRDDKALTIVDASAGKVDALTTSEYAYTTALLHTNLSNFSAWHARTKLLPRLYPTPSPASKAAFHGEIAFLRSALLLDPYDQSLWKYHEYLLFVLGASPTLRSTPGTVESRDAAWVSFDAGERQEILQEELRELETLEEDCADCKWLCLGLIRIMEGMEARDEGRMREWLSRLKDLDSIRGQRWIDLEQRLDLAKG